MKKLVSIVFSVILIFSVIAPAYAEDLETPVEDPIIEEYQGIRYITADISISGSSATCYGVVDGRSSYSYSMTVYLQKLSGSNWNSIASWSATGSGNLGVSLTKAKNGLTSGTYRCKVYVSVYDSNGQFVESATVCSRSSSY
jgi:hypothetical protein